MRPEIRHQAHRQAEQDLVRYFTEYPACLQPASNFSAMVAAIGARGEQSSSAAKLSWQVVTPSGSHGLRAREEAVEMNERTLKRADEERPVRRVLAGAGPWAAHMLRTGCVGPTNGLEAFGARAALALESTSARRAWLESSTTRSFEEWLVRLNHRVRTEGSNAPAVDRLLAQDISREAAGLWREALAAYHRAQDRWRELQRLRRETARQASAARGEAVGSFDVSEPEPVCTQHVAAQAARSAA